MRRWCFDTCRIDLLLRRNAAFHARHACTELMELRERYSPIDTHQRKIDELRNPPASLQDCVFARTTLTFSADLKTKRCQCGSGMNELRAQHGQGDTIRYPEVVPNESAAQAGVIAK